MKSNHIKLIFEKISKIFFQIEIHFIKMWLIKVYFYYLWLYFACMRVFVFYYSIKIIKLNKENISQTTQNKKKQKESVI